MIRVVVVDDSAFMRRAISQMLASDPMIQVVATGRNGLDAVELVRQHKPDVLTLDIEMPQMDGLTALERIMRESPVHVLMISSLTTDGSHAALRALSLGASDVLAKDSSQISLSITRIQAELLAKVRMLAASRRPRPTSARTAQSHAQGSAPVLKPGQFDLLCIGSSTGGPPVLETILSALPSNFQIPVIVAQHMPAMFTLSMAQRLSQICSIPVVHAADAMPVERRTIYIAPGGKHTHIVKTGPARWRLSVNDQPTTAVYRPSVDALLQSQAGASGSRSLAVILTGMGNDGLEGARALHACGGIVLAQDEETCVVYGMPKAVTENGLVRCNLSPERIGGALQGLASPVPPRRTGASPSQMSPQAPPSVAGPVMQNRA